MTYILPVLYVIVSYTFFLLAGCFDNAIKLQILSILLPFIMGIVNLIVVLTVGRKWSRKTLLNCTLIIKYGPVSYTHLDVYKRQGAAYDKAVEVVTDKVREQTQLEDMEVIEKYRKSVVSPNAKNSPEVVKIANALLSRVREKLPVSYTHLKEVPP